MNPIVYAIPVFVLAMLAEAAWAWRRGERVYDLGDAVTSLQHGVLSQVAGAFTKLATLGIYVAVYDAYRATTWPLDEPLLWLLALVGYDFLYYWFHRLSHEVALLWAAHVVHHSSEYYNLSTALRQTSSTALVGWVFYLPLALLGVPPPMFVVVGLIDLLYQFWPHTQLIGRLGWADRVFVTPSNHRVHHGQNDYCMDVNYGGILILWDRLFGSFREERADEPVCYGVRKPLHSFNPLWGNLQVYADLSRQSLQAPGWRAKIGVWLAPPGGWPDGPMPHFDPAAFQRYAPPTPPAVRRYVLVQYAVATLAVMAWLAAFARLSTPVAAAGGAWFALTALALGMLLEGRRGARAVEVARLLLAGGFLVVLAA